MEDAQPPAPMPPANMPEKSSGSKLAWIVALVMALVAGSFGYLYFTKDKTEPQPQAEQNQAAANTEESARTIYRAEVGKFSINLSNSYGVVENLDGNFEGGPATEVEIGSVAALVSNVITSSPIPFTIFAKADPDATLTENFIISSIIDSSPETTKVGNITFADTPAVSYKSIGLVTSEHIIFIKNAILYHIEFPEGEASEETLNAVEAGWEFIE